MPSPVQSDLHISQPLTNVSIAYHQSADAFLADKIFAKVPVEKQNDVYWKYSKSDWRRSDVKRRAPGTESAGSGWNNDEDDYRCHVYALHKDIDDQTRANADSNFNLDRDATEFISNQHLLDRDIKWAATYMVTGVWATEYEGVAAGPTGTQFLQWNDAASDPVTDTTNWQILFRQFSGFKWNVCVMGAFVMAALKNHPDLIDRIKFTQKGIVNEDLVATLFEVDELYVSYATEATGPFLDDAATQDAAATYSFIGDPYAVLFAYRTKSPSLLTPSAGYTFVWKGYQNSEGVRVKKFRMEHLESDRVEGSTAYDMKVVCSDMGVFVRSAVATVG